MKIYKTIGELLLEMVSKGELTKRQLQRFTDAQENERAEWRNQMIKVANIAYDAGRKHDVSERQALVDDIVGGGFDV